MFYFEGHQTPHWEQVAQRCGWPNPVTVESQVGKSLEQPGLVGGVPVYGRECWGWVIFKAIYYPLTFYDSFCDSVIQ